MATAYYVKLQGVVFWHVCADGEGLETLCGIRIATYPALRAQRTLPPTVPLCPDCRPELAASAEDFVRGA